ncbi:pre-rRNA processing protein FTSJ3 [Lingula anatina]|uniref:Putative rRNA methyltransferase n=1 Tax=Lingula anatina TaxID=7574 RepID=A0A1S3IPD9_LINAN|nr:pre-rRNA processing protein FTSJ3 [Lingula anatina]|eukprot:XP_013399943.1 pre-rRNA processing protein FTSJ3 [Lingula anatina]
MGKKTKVGKARKDKFYQLAKETGYRSRASFKLLQLNRKFEFLQNSRVLIDLCAAPGGWLQVAAQHMPVSSVIVGVDLVPIKPIHNVTTLTEDITTEKCRQALRQELKTWKADCVLNDGAPNVGKNWIHDAYTQAELTLHALKLATEMLKKGGWFVTKVFRSKDYQPLMWVLQQLFKKVHATKPQASRNESAEIFVVCQGFISPDKMDPKFLDPKHIFKDVDVTKKLALDLLHPEKHRRQREGYADGDYTLYHVLNASEYINSENHLQLLAECNKIQLDDRKIASHPLTTTEIKECCQDIKVLGKKEIRSLITWRNKLRKEFHPEENKVTGAVETIEEDEDDDDDDVKVEQQLSELQDEQKKEQKRKEKKVRKEKSKLRHKMDLKMIIPGDKIDMSDDLELFKLNKIKSKEQLSELEKGDIVEEEDSYDGSDIVLPKNYRPTVSYDRDDSDDYYEDTEGKAEDGQDEQEEESDSDEDGDEPNSALDEKSQNPLVVDLEDKDGKTNRRTDNWFKKAIFSGIDDNQDEDLEIARMTEEYTKKGGVILGRGKQKRKLKEKSHEDLEDSDMEFETKQQDSYSGHDSDSDNAVRENRSGDEETDASSDSDSDSDASDYDVNKSVLVNKKSGEKMIGKASHGQDDFEVVPVVEPAHKIPRLDPAGLAIGAKMIQSGKKRREIINQAYNRYTFNDENLPDWFVKDEAKHIRKQLPVTKQDVQEYRERLKAINVRPIKKLAEAKARKKKKAMKKLENARKKADVISEAVDVTDREKWQQIKQIYKKAGILGKKKPEVAYVVAKKGAGKRVGRPAGVKGRFKVVDPRMKKDMKKMKTDKKGKNKKRRRGK